MCIILSCISYWLVVCVCVCLSAVLATPRGYLIKLGLEYVLSTILITTLPVVDGWVGIGVVVQGKSLIIVP